MRLEDISLKFIEGTERPYDKNPVMYEIDAENLEEIELCTCGEHLKKKHKTERKIYDYRPSPFTGIEHIYLVNLSSQRYICTNPDCRCSFTAGLLDRSKSSRAFGKFLVQKLLDKERLSFSKVGEELGISHSFVSDTVMEYISDFNLHYSPSQFCKYLYLHEFTYQNMPRYALISVNNLDEKHLIGFFGYKDPIKEFSEYFRFHLKDEQTWFTIATEHAEIIASKFEQFPGQLFFRETQAGREKALRDKYIYNRGIYDAIDKHEFYVEILNEIIGKLKGPTPHQELEKWWHKPKKSIYLENAKLTFKDLIAYLLKDGSAYAAEFSAYPIDFDAYEKHINRYKKKNIPFEKMCLHMMHKEYQKYNKKHNQNKHILTDTDSDIMYYDDQNNIIYRSVPLEDVEKLKEDAHRRFELYKEEAEIYDTFDLFEPEDVDLCDDPSELPEDVIQEMASYAPDISEEDLYYIQQFLDD